MARYRLDIEYDGSAFCGWQRQANALAVQQVIEEALGAVDGAPVVIKGAGRTDTGVHATAQVATCDLIKDWRGDKLRDAVNAHMRPHLVAIRKAELVADDFDDVVRGDDIPFSHHVRDALLLVENPAEVAYKLGKNKAELERISKLHPIDQAREVNKLSFSLMGGKDGKSSSPSKASPLGNIRQNPAHSSHAVTDKTPPSEIRRRMKAGTWK